MCSKSGSSSRRTAPLSASMSREHTGQVNQPCKLGSARRSTLQRGQVSSWRSIGDSSRKLLPILAIVRKRVVNARLSFDELQRRVAQLAKATGRNGAANRGAATQRRASRNSVFYRVHTSAPTPASTPSCRPPPNEALTNGSPARHGRFVRMVERHDLFGLPNHPQEPERVNRGE